MELRKHVNASCNHHPRTTRGEEGPASERAISSQVLISNIVRRDTAPSSMSALSRLGGHSHGQHLLVLRLGELTGRE